MSDLVCATDGVPVTANRLQRLVHLGELPKGTDPDHEIRAVAPAEFASGAGAKLDIRAAVEDMLAHHATLHPVSDCEWARVLARAAVRLT